MNIKEKIEEIITKIKEDDTLAARFMDAPVKTVEELLGVDLPDEQVKAAVEAIKAKIDREKIGTTVDSVVDKLDDMADRLSDKLEGLFDKK